jgi:hypothetical protein
VSTPRIPFGWEHLDDSLKHYLLDSTVSERQRIEDSVSSAAAAKAAAESGSRGRVGAAPVTLRAVYVAAGASELPDYRPAFRLGATRPDAEGNLWIETTLIVDKRPVYDVVNRKGELIDRVQLPRFRQIAGFGPGVIYMSVLDSLRVAHLERARIK